MSSDDDEMEALWKQAYSLEAFTASGEFKEYEAIENRLNAVLGLSTPRAVAQAQQEEEFEPVATTTIGSNDFNSPDITASSTDDDDALSYFQKLAEE